MEPLSALGSGEKKDNVTLPDHYARFKIEPITFICENKLDFFQGNIVKYVCRHDAKNGIEDLKKAKRYLEMYIKYLQDDPTWPAKPEAPKDKPPLGYVPTDCVTYEEGGDWERFKTGRKNPHLGVYAIRFMDGSVWDVTNGWRKHTL
jgi:hypothetical protein